MNHLNEYILGETNTTAFLINILKNIHYIVLHQLIFLNTFYSVFI